MCCSIGVIYKLKPFLLKSALFKIYYGIIHPYHLYALPAWGSTYPTHMSKLCILQNKAIKLICVMAISQTTYHPITLN